MMRVETVGLRRLPLARRNFAGIEENRGTPIALRVRLKGALASLGLEGPPSLR